MAGISSTVRLNDGMTSPLKNINKALTLVIDHMEQMQRVSGEGMNTANLVKAKSYLSQADREVDKIIVDTNQMSQAQSNYNSKVRAGKSEVGGLGSKVKGMIGAFGGLMAVKGSIDFIGECSDKASNLAQQETKLSSVMKAMQGASSSQVQGVKNLSTQIAKNGVVGKTAMISGAQQVSTYFHQTKAVETLLPKMADLAIQMHGVNTTSEDMVNIGNMFGKVMTGQVGALRRAGISFDENQEKVMKNGTEMEKAAMLAQVVTQNVGNMNEEMTNTPEGAVARVKRDFEGVKTSIGQDLRGSIVEFYQSIHNGLPIIKAIGSAFSKVVSIIMKIVSKVINIIVKVAKIFQKNWSVISPIIYGIIAALTVYYGRLVLVKLGELADAAATGVMSVAKGLAAAATTMFTGATWAQAKAQWGLNDAMYACPLVWILALIIAVIAVIYAVVAAINKVTGSSISATGVICGGIAAVGAALWNIIGGAVKFVVGIGVELYNLIGAFANFFANVFNDPVGAIVHLFVDMFDFIVGIVQSVAELLDMVFGSNMADAIQGFRNDTQQWADDLVGKQEQVMPKLSQEDVLKDMGLDRIAYTDAYNSGYKVGEGLENKVSSMFDFKNDLGKSQKDAYNQQDVNDKIASNTGDTASNTKDIADKLDVTSDQLKYIREYAEREAINRFTTANVNVKMTNNNNISSTSDVDGILDAMTTGIKKQMNIVAEGGA